MFSQNRNYSTKNGTNLFLKIMSLPLLSSEPEGNVFSPCIFQFVVVSHGRGGDILLQAFSVCCSFPGRAGGGGASFYPRSFQCVVVSPGSISQGFGVFTSQIISAVVNKNTN